MFLQIRTSNFNILLNYNKYIQITNGDANTSWGWSDFYTYLLLKPGTNANALQAKMPAFAERYMGKSMKNNGFKVSFNLQPLKDIHTRSVYDYEMDGSGNFYYLKYLGIAALLILLIALINYINLSTAHSLERSKEVGVRKVVGATKFQLVRQFLAETFLINAFGIIIGFLLFKFALPQFSQLINQNVIDLQTGSWQFWIIVFNFRYQYFTCGLLSCFCFVIVSTCTNIEISFGFCGHKKRQQFF